VKRPRRLVERVPRVEHDLLVVIDPEDHAALDYIHVRSGRVPMRARPPARLVVDADGVDDASAARWLVEHLGDALAGVRVGHGGLLMYRHELDGTLAGASRRFGLPQTRSEIQTQLRRDARRPTRAR
jgi:hypothetical protein